MVKITKFLLCFMYVLIVLTVSVLELINFGIGSFIERTEIPSFGSRNVHGFPECNFSSFNSRLMFYYNDLNLVLGAASS